MLAGEGGDEGLLLGGLNGLGTVVGTGSGHRLARSAAAEDSEAGQNCSGAPMSTEAAEFDALAGASTLEERPESGEDLSGIIGDGKIRPVKVLVGPRGLPSAVQVEPVIGGLVAPVGIVGIEGHGSDLCQVGQEDH